MIETHKKWYHEPTVIVAFITVVGGGIFTLINKKCADDPVVTPSTTTPIVQTTVTVNNSNNATNEITEQVVKVDNSPQNRNSYFSVSGTTFSQEILNIISKKINKKYSTLESPYIIKFNHSGEIAPVKFSNTLYKYNGGYLTISVNGFTCSISDQYYLAPTLSAGNPKESVEQLIDSMKQNLIIKKIETISNDIKLCIK
ncbi:MAG: hypothetical protein NW218_00785 [Saprospiraceae bacterium]|nr:hypothetical protein [Saprospiraceae bacterium]